MGESTLPFSLREDMILGTKIYVSAIAKFGLTAHAGSKEKSSKTKVIFISSISNLSIDEILSVVIGNINHSPNLKAMCMSANETDAFEIDDSSRCILIADKLKCISSVINPLLRDTVDVSARIKAANKVIGAMLLTKNLNSEF